MSNDTRRIIVSLAVFTASPPQFLVVDDDDGFMDPDVPGYPLLDGHRAKAVAAEVLERHTGLRDGEWLNLRQVGFDDERDDGYVRVVYAAELPHPLPIKDARWASFQDVSAHPHLVRTFMRATHAIRS